MAAPVPTLRDGSLVLRPWTDADLARLSPRALDSGWFREGEAPGGSPFSLLIEDDNALLGGVLLRYNESGSADLSWKLFYPDSQLIGVRAVQLALEHAFQVLGVPRVEARADADDPLSSRVAARAGMLKEGTARGAVAGDGGRIDQDVYARLATDPDVTEQGSFARVLNSTLPTKRAIAQALIRNDAGEVLLCEPTYKKFWDLPGGVVDPSESPAHAVLREVAEELSLNGKIRSLAAVTWLPPWRGWDDATLFVFDVWVPGEPGALQPREIRAVHWRPVADVGAHCADYTGRLIHRAVQAIDERTGVAYLENSYDPAW